ncbi:MAG TPA: SpoIIE family protein phosphatase [Clostridiaceae bacterium]|nr:SpoIIE family protein phosphatase [Clostridiaceae bacterium]
MENVSVLKSERKPLKSLIFSISNIGIPRLVSFAFCLVFTRANLLGVIRPFAAAFYTAAWYSGISKVFAIISITIGNLLFSNIYETIRQTLSLVLFELLSNLVFKTGTRNETAFSRSVLSGAIIGFTGILRGAVQGFHIYDLIASVLCGTLVFSFSIVLSHSAEMFEDTNPRFIIDGKAFFSRTVLVSVAIISLEGVMLGSCELGTVLAGLAILIIARRRGSGAGALAGTALGMVIALFNLPASLQVPGMFALAGAMAGLPVKNRVVSSLLWTLTVIFFSGLSVLDGKLIIKYYEALAAGIMFLLIPGQALGFLSDQLAGIKLRIGSREVYDTDRTHEAADRLYVLSKALARVARSIEETAENDREDDYPITQWIIEAIAEKVCNRCSMCERCWNTHFYKTYKLVEDTISNPKTDETGQPEVPGWFRSLCTKQDKFFDALETAFSVYKTDRFWRQKLGESRMLLGRQAAIVSGGIMAFARSLNGSTGRDTEIEEKLLCAAQSRNLPVSGFRYYPGDGDKPCLEVIFEAKNKLSANDLDEFVRENVQKNFIRIGESRRDLMGYSVVRYMKKPKYKTITGIARASRDNQGVSGDNFAFFITSQGFHVSAVSDGSGSGRRAERFSRAAIQMLENMLEDGIDVNLAIRFLNLYLNLRGENDRLATADICAIDLSSGATSFYKYGASPSFIKTRQGTHKINSESTDPDNVIPAHYSPADLSAGDLVIMLSDGVLEAFSRDGEIMDLQNCIDGLDSSNTQQIADSILQEALARSGEKHDDMTVLVTKLW